jgi:WD40 repeat protein
LKIERIDTFAGHRGAVYALEKAVDNALFYSAGADGWVVQWNLQKPDLGKVIAQIQGSIYAMRLDHLSGILWVAQNNEGIHGIHVGTLDRVFSIPMLNQSIYDIQFWGDQVWVASSRGMITVVDRLSHQVLKHVKVGEAHVRCLMVVGQQIFAGYSDGNMRVFSSQFELVYAKLAHEKRVFALIEVGETLISVGGDAHIRAWHWESNDLIQVLPAVPAHIQAINAVVLSPCGRYLATGSMDKTIKIWHVTDLTLLKVIDFPRYGGHKHSINALIWSDYTDLLVSGSDDKQISVWKID